MQFVIYWTDNRVSLLIDKTVGGMFKLLKKTLSEYCKIF